jgi:hypothetical protein
VYDSRPAVLALALAAALAGALPARAASPRWPQPQRYSLALRWHSDTQTLTGRQRIAFVNDGPRTLGSVWLRLWPNGYGSCSQRWARISGVRGGRVSAMRAGCTAVRVRLNRPLAPGGNRSLGLRLHVTVQPRPNRFGQEAGVAYLGNALPLLAVDDAAGAHIDPYSDLGDPFYSLSATWSVRLDLPRGLVAATTGSVQSRTRIPHGLKRLRIGASHARDFAIVIGKLAVESTTTSSGIRLKRYRLPSHSRSAALATLATATAAVDRYRAWYGSPGVREIDVVEGPSSLGPFGFGMEFPGLVLASDGPLVVAHELAHQWWYSLVGDDEWRAPWLDESFAEYASRRLPASVVGEDNLHCDFADPVAPFGSAPLTSTMAHWDAAGAAEYYRTVYLGGTCALRSLEHDLGESAMAAFLRSYIASHRYGVTTTADFVAALRAAAPTGYDVDAFLKRARIVAP